MLAPKLAADCHFHIFGPFDKFPLDPGRHYEPKLALIEDYLAMAGTVGLERMVIVTPSPYGTDNRVTLDAIERFGRHRAVGVAVIDDRWDDAALRRLAPLGWHIQVYADGQTLADIAQVLAALPVAVVVDHIGGVKAALGTAHPQFQALLRLLDSGNAWVKTCSYRASSTGHPWADTGPNVRALVAAAPERCVWGTDWPHSSMQPPLPVASALLDQFFEFVPDASVRQRILVDNPAQLYGFPAG